MGRIRTIKPDLFRHEGLFELEMKSRLPIRLAFTALMTVADKEGRFEWRPRRIKLDVLPWDEIDMGEILISLQSQGFIQKYVANGKEYGVFPTWHRHQRVKIDEAASRIPAPPPIGLDSVWVGSESVPIGTEPVLTGSAAQIAITEKSVILAGSEPVRVGSESVPIGMETILVGSEVQTGSNCVPIVPGERIGSDSDRVGSESDPIGTDSDKIVVVELEVEGELEEEEEGEGEGECEGKPGSVPEGTALPPIDILWNSNSGTLPKVRECTNQRKRSWAARFREKPEAAYWAEVFCRIAASPFCNGANDRGWRAGIDFALKPGTHVKAMEGQYDAGPVSGRQTHAQTVSNANRALFDAIDREEA